MTITTNQLRQAVVDEATVRAKRESKFLFVFEYKDTLFENVIWTTLAEGEAPPPQDSRLLCTVDSKGNVDWKVDDLYKPRSRPRCPASSDITLPIEEVQFNNVTITVPATNAAAAYATLCKALEPFEYTTDTFQTNGADGEISEEQTTTALFPQTTGSNRNDHNQSTPN
jgi:hypothetical protein